MGKASRARTNDSVKDMLASPERQRRDHWEPHAKSAGDNTRHPGCLFASSPDEFSQLTEITVRLVNFCHLRLHRRALAEYHLAYSRSEPIQRELLGQGSLSFPEVFKPMYLPPIPTSWQFDSITVVIHFVITILCWICLIALKSR